MPQARLEQVRTSAKLRPFLSHSKLRKLIREIDAHQNRKQRLWQQLAVDRDFRDFVDDMLREMGYLDANN